MSWRSLEEEARGIEPFEVDGSSPSEEALRASEEKYRTLFEAIDEGLAIAEVVLDDSGEGVDYRILEANARFENLTGMSREEFLGGKTVRELIPGAGNAWARTLGRVAVRGESVRFECHSKLMDRWFEVYVFRIGDPSLRRVASLYNDITTRRRAEEALRSSEKIQAYLLKLSDVLRPIADPVEIMSAAPEVLARELGVPVAGYVEIGEDGDSIVVGGQYADGRMPELKGPCRFSEFGDGIAPVLAAGEEVFVSDVYADPRGSARGSEKLRDFEIRSVAGIPLIKDGRLVAFFYATHFDTRTWASWEREIFKQTAERTWAAVERARAQSAQRDSEEKYRTLFNLIDQGFAVMEVLYDESGAPCNLRFTEANPAFEKRTGLTNPVGKTSCELIPNLEDSCLQAYAKVVETGESVRFESYSHDFDRWLDIFASRIGGEGSRLVSVIFDDITDRKRAEAALRASEEKYRSLCDWIDQGYAVLEVLYDETGAPIDLRFVATNRGFERQTGYSDYVGKTARELNPNLEDSWVETYAEVVKSRKAVRFERYAHEIDRWFNIFASPIGEDHSPLLNVVFEDITARKQADAALRSSEEKQTYKWKLSDAIRSLSDPVEIQWTASQILGEHLRANRVFYGEIDEEAGALLIEQDFVREGTPSAAGQHSMEVFAWLRSSSQKFQPTVVKDVQASEMLPEVDRVLLAAVQAGAFIAVPLVKDGKLVGCLCATDSSSRDWTEDEVELVWHTGERTWAAVERARAAAALRASEEKYRTLFDSVDSAVAVLEVLYDDRGNPTNLGFVETNHVFERLTGLQNHIGKTTRDLLPQLEDSCLESYARVVETGESTRFESYSHDFGRWISISASRVGGEGSRLVNVFFDDITERKQAETALRESEERQAYLLKLSDALRVLRDPVEIQETASRLLGEHLRTDRAFYSKLDVERGKLIVERDYVREGTPSLAGCYPLSPWAWIEKSAEKGQPTVISNVRTSPLIPDADRAVILNTRVSSFICVPLLKDDRKVSALCVADMEPRAWTEVEVALVRDTADRTWAAVERAKAEAALSESEERFRLFLENVHEYAFVQVNSELRMTSWNPGAERIFGYSSQEALGKPFALLLSAEDREIGVQCMAISDLEKVGRSEDARWLVRKDGQRIWIRWVSEPIRDENGRITGLTKVLRDETERLKAETRLRQSEKLAVVGRMASSIAHEINNPLEATMNLIYLAGTCAISSEAAEFLRQAERELARVNHIATATLHFHRQTPEPAQVDVEEILESILLLHEGRLKATQVSTDRRYGSHPTINCLANEIRQVFANLVGNAIDAMARNSEPRRLIIRIGKAINPKSGEPGVRVMIADTGSGIRESARSHVFEPFFTTKSATGTGLGLWISAETVKKHQGTLRFRSRTTGQYRGTVFSVFLGKCNGNES